MVYSVKQYLLHRYAQDGKIGFTWKNIRDEISKSYAPDRPDASSKDRREINSVLLSMAGEGLLRLRRVEEEKAYDLYNGSFTEKMESCAKNAGYVTKNASKRAALCALRAFRPESTQMKAFKEKQEKQLEEKMPLTIWGREVSVRLLTDALKGADMVFLNKGLIYYRNFSIRTYSDTKALEDPVLLSHLESFVKAAAPQEILAMYEERKEALGQNFPILSLFGIIKSPYYIPVCGDLEIVTKRGSIFTRGLPYAFHTLDLDAYEHIYVRDGSFMTIENRTTYEDADPEGAKFYTGGFPGFAEKAILTKIYRDNPDISYLHWSDIDCGGFRIFYNIKEILPGLSPFNMDRDFFTRHILYAKPLSEKERGELGKYREDAFFSDVSKEMLKTGKKLEQESCYA